ncbi:MAG: hypothetical protein JW727_00470 [Candidatus Aenigmarchaeota archaeon]|nr:hypothetical protein [Candidatus Aenigmarchaeota archaeon]
MSDLEWGVYLPNISEGDLEKVKSVHKLVLELEDGLFREGPARNLLLNGGRPLGIDEPPQSFLELGSSVWNREKTRAHIFFLEEAINRVLLSGPVEYGGVLDVPKRPNSSSVRDAFLTDPDLYSEVYGFSNQLWDALGWYNKQAVLERMDNARGIFIYDSDFPEEHNLQGRIRATGIQDKGILGALDGAYYELGNGYFRKAGEPWRALNGMPHGQFFTLFPDEAKAFVKLLRSGAEPIY